MGDNLAILIGPALASLALYLWVAASLHAVFHKAGQPGWQAWVPVLNLIVLLRLGGLSGWWALLLVIPVVGTIGLAIVVWIACHRINLAFGVGAGMTVLAIVLFPVWSSVLGWGSARWIGREDRPASSHAAAAPELAGRVGAHVVVDDAAAPRPKISPALAPADRPAPAASAVTAASSLAAVPISAHLDDEASPHDYSPRRRAHGYAADASERQSDRATAVPPAPGSDGQPPAEYSGPVPRILGATSHGVPAGPRRAVVPGAENEPDELTQPRDAPVHGMPPAADPSAAVRDPWAPPIHVLPPLRTPRRAPALDETGSDSGEVSAVAGAPALGTPMPARSSVSAKRTEPQVPDADGPLDDTVIAARRKTPWTLVPPLGAPIPVMSDVLIVGRRPNVDPEFPHAQLVRITDETRTMSKTHARLELDGDGWSIVDLDSTNGVLLLHADGTEVDLVSGRPEPATESFLLGDAEVRLTREPSVE